MPSRSESQKIKPNTCIEGYFFNCKYFSSYNDEIIKMFSNLALSKNSLIVANMIQQEKANTIAIHFRDYSDVRASGAKVKDDHGVLSIDYYIAAFQIINEKCNNTKFYVFSNKIENAKKLFATIKNLEFIECSPDNMWKDMKLMSLCNHNIIANSYYYYWAAYLNIHENKIVIAPNYFSPRQKNYNDFCPDNWIKVDTPFQ